jgi:hypothetical protein
MMNNVLRLAVDEFHCHSTRLVHRIDLKAASVRRHRIKPVNGLAPKIVASNPAQDCGMIAQPPSHHGEIRWCPTQTEPFRQNIPEQFANSQNQMRFCHGSSPVKKLRS